MVLPNQNPRFDLIFCDHPTSGRNFSGGQRDSNVVLWDWCFCVNDVQTLGRNKAYFAGLRRIRFWENNLRPQSL